MGQAVRRQSAVSFGLSFLDVLCCGLGAAVLLLLVIKHGPTDAEVEDLGLLETQITEIQKEISIKNEEKTELKRISTEMANQMGSLTSQGSAKNAISTLQAERLSVLLRELQTVRDRLRKSEEALAQASKTSQQKKPIPTPSSGKNHLTGLIINQDHVAILLDTSASMLATNLVEIIRLRASPVGAKLQAEKWARAKGAALWAYNKIPPGAKFQIVTFNETATDLRGHLSKTQQNISWLSKENAQFDTKELKSKLDQVIPNGPTDLKSALILASELRPKPVQIILITDGLPTLPGRTSLSRFSPCPKTVPAGRAPLLSPECRQRVMDDALSMGKRLLRNTRIDSILFPLEGDSNSIDGYWKFTREFGGRVLSPYAGWPHS